MKINTHLNILLISLITILFYINIKCIDDATLNNCNSNQIYDTINYKCIDKIICEYGYYYNSTTKNCELCENYTVSSGERKTCVKCVDENGAIPNSQYGNYINEKNETVFTCGCENIGEENVVYVQIEKDKSGNDLEYQYCNKKINLNESGTIKIGDTNRKVILQSDIKKINGALYLNQSNTFIKCISTYKQINNTELCIPSQLEDNFFSSTDSTITANLIFSERYSPYELGNYKNRPTRDSDFVSYIKRPSEDDYSSTESISFNINLGEVINYLFHNDNDYLKNYCAIALYSQNFELCNRFGYNKVMEPANFLCDPEKIPNPVIVGNINNENVELDKLDYYFSKWDESGQFIDNVKKNELIICSETYNDSQDFKKVGATLVNECFMDVNKLLNETSYFYEMYLNLPNYKENPVPIYVIIDNENGQRTKILNDNNCNEFNLRKRFFIFKKINNNQLIYAKTIKLKVRFQNREHRKDNRIFAPYLRIEYFSHNLNTNNNNRDNANNLIMVSFRSEYNMDERAHIIPSIYTIFYIFLTLTGIFVVIKMCIWSKIHTYNLSRDNYFVFFIINFFIYLFKYVGLFLFLFSFVVTFYWYVFYKLQFRAYVFLPDLDIAYRSLYKNFNIVWGIGCCSYFIYMLSRIYDQLNYDVFFIDWEHDKDLLVNYNANNIHSSKYKGAWRAIHIANQFNILQKERTISISICFGFLIMLWYYHRTHWNQFAQMSPNVAWVEHSPENMYLRHFITTFVLVITGLVQYFLRRILNLILIPLKKNEFLDLCSVANISVIILDDKLHGYYIHGQSPFGKADTNFVDLIQFLEEERKGKIRGRGLTGDEEDNLQSYEIYLSNNMRDIYDDLYYIEVNQEINAAEENDRAGNQSRYPIFFRYIPKKLDVDKYYHLNNYMNTQLKNKIQQVASQSKIFVKERTLLERFLQLPPNLDLISANARELVFYKDPGMNFDNVCFTGMEIEWLILVAYVFQMWCISLHKYSDCLPVAIFMTYLMEKVAFRLRVYYGEKNVARKAVIDNRFL